MLLNAGINLTPESAHVIIVIAILFVVGLPFKIWHYRRKSNKKK